MRKHRIGIVDLDSSHPLTFIQGMRDFGNFEISAVCDAGDVREQGYAAQFATDHAIPLVVDSPADMVSKVDAALILTVDWDKHLERARPFLEAGLPVFIDKPVFGCLRDGYEMKRLADLSGAPLMGGSTMRYYPGVAAMRAELADKRNMLDSAFISGPGTFIYYGIHTVETVYAVLGAGIYKVRQAGQSKELFELVYRDGLTVWMKLECARPVSFTVFTKNKPAVILEDKTGLGMIAEFAKMLETRCPPIPFNTVIETTAVLIAVHKARNLSDWVYVDDLSLDEGPDGAAFTQQYRHN